LKSDQDQCAGTRAADKKEPWRAWLSVPGASPGNLPAHRPRDLVTHCIKRHIDAQRLNTLRIAQSERELIEQFAGDAADPTPHHAATAWLLPFFTGFQRDPR
jgi:hypothetical protein